MKCCQKHRKHLRVPSKAQAGAETGRDRRRRPEGGGTVSARRRSGSSSERRRPGRGRRGCAAVPAAWRHFVNEKERAREKARRLLKHAAPAQESSSERGDFVVLVDGRVGDWERASERRKNDADDILTLLHSRLLCPFLSLFVSTPRSLDFSHAVNVDTICPCSPRRRFRCCRRGDAPGLDGDRPSSPARCSAIAADWPTLVCCYASGSLERVERPPPGTRAGFALFRVLNWFF